MKRQSKKEREQEQNLRRNREVERLRIDYQNRESELSEAGFNVDALVKQRVLQGEEISIERGIKKWDDQQLKVPTGRYKDWGKTAATYQQKFVEFISQVSPQVIEELKELVPYFTDLFDKQQNNYWAVFHELKANLTQNYVPLKYELTDCLNKPLNNNYYWGDCETVLLLLQYQLQQSKRSSSTTKTNESFINLLEKQKINLESAKRKIARAFQETTSSIEKIEFNFLALQIGLIKWAERHHLQKDWLIDCAYYFIWQFSNNPCLQVADMKVKLPERRSLETKPFNFRVRGWRVGDEDKEDYEKRITEKFCSELEKYFDSTYRSLDLGEKVKITNPIQYERVKWLVWWTVLEWDKDRILQELIIESQPKEYELSTIYKAFKEFQKYGLPVRK